MILQITMLWLVRWDLLKPLYQDLISPRQLLVAPRIQMSKQGSKQMSPALLTSREYRTDGIATSDGLWTHPWPLLTNFWSFLLCSPACYKLHFPLSLWKQSAPATMARWCHFSSWCEGRGEGFIAPAKWKLHQCSSDNNGSPERDLTEGTKSIPPKNVLSPH